MISMNTDSSKINDFYVTETRKTAKWVVLEPPQHPQTPKLCGKRCISIPFSSTKKYFFYAKIIFSQEFWFFSDPQSEDFRDLGDPAMCPYLEMCG